MMKRREPVNTSEPPSSFLPDQSSCMDTSHPVECVRCHYGLEEYSFARLPLQSYGAGDGHIMLECPRCGHIEFLSSTSPLVAKLQATSTYVGDDD